MSNSNAIQNVTGHCLCGGVRYKASAVRREIIQCHCEMCRRQTGGLWMATHVVRSEITIEDDDCLMWYQSSPHAKRGFCNKCGSSLFIDNDERPTMGIGAGSVDQPSGLELAVHIFADDAADYDVIEDGLRRVPDGNPGLVYP